MGEPRPSWEEYKMALAVEVASRSSCVKTHVGAILLKDNRVRAVGYNGTIEGYDHCFDGGCPRCRDLRIERAEGLDRCVCVHAEENALVSAARYGIPVEGSECYVTHEPCLGCTKLLVQAHIKTVVYLLDYQYPDSSDHNESRVRMREASRGRSGIVFQPFEEVVPESRKEAVREQVQLWGERLAKMKKDALDYAEARGVIVRE